MSMEALPGLDMASGAVRVAGKVANRVVAAINAATAATRAWLQSDKFDSGGRGCAGTPGLLHNRSGTLRDAINAREAEIAIPA